MTRFIDQFTRHKHLFIEYANKKNVINKFFSNWEWPFCISTFLSYMVGCGFFKSEQYAAGIISWAITGAIVLLYWKAVPYFLYKKMNLHIIEPELFALLESDTDVDLQHLQKVHGTQNWNVNDPSLKAGA